MPNDFDLIRGNSCIFVDKAFAFAFAFAFEIVRFVRVVR